MKRPIGKKLEIYNCKNKPAFMSAELNLILIIIISLLLQKI